MGNEEKPPMTAAARIGMTMSERFSLLRLVIGTKKIAANPPSAAPMAQLATAITSEEIYERFLKYLTGCADLFREGYTDVCQFTCEKAPA